jgi:hypothetical protein
VLAGIYMAVLLAISLNRFRLSHPA